MTPVAQMKHASRGSFQTFARETLNVLLPEFFAVFGDGDHGRALFFDDVVFDLLVLVVVRLKLPHDGGDLFHVDRHPFGLRAGEEGAQNSEGHFAEAERGLVAVDALVEVGLTKRFHPPFFIDVENVRGFDAVADRKGDLLQHRAANRVFPGQGLDEGCQFGEEE